MRAALLRDTQSSVIGASLSLAGPQIIMSRLVCATLSVRSNKVVGLTAAAIHRHRLATKLVRSLRRSSTGAAPAFRIPAKHQNEFIALASDLPRVWDAVT